MTWDQSTAWWVATGLLVVLELTSGTFYLLMLGIGTAAGALAAHAGLPFPGQLVAAAAVGGAAVTFWRRRRLAHPAAPRAAENPDVNMDVGSRVQVDAWGDDRQATVHYRGAAWNARFGGSGAPAPGEHVIVAVEGLQLVLDRAVR
ncbi:NfeD family protein [Ideonella sp.]|uniref:NfeD family protein n=1 Tax=Ideonella sp. TaxID=1929293 RepID=UPI002B4867ED|nr:NfeD family protein [Ideonella sp.]HJV71144.1 NfeD family protein [Ideonella sp.]